MRLIKNVFSQLHSFALWMLMSFLIWGWIFTLVTDTSAEKKVTVYCNVPLIEDKAMALKLEENMPDGLKMVKVHSFRYVMFDMENMELGDIFILPESEIDTFRAELRPISGDVGEKVYDAASGTGIATEYITYGDEDYYLFLGGESVHLEDGVALEMAKKLMALP